MKKKSVFLLLCVQVMVVTGGVARAVSPCPMVPVVAERLPDLTIPRSGHSVFYVNHELTVAGGHTNGFVLTPTAEYFKNGAWHVLPMIYSHDNGAVVVQQSGQVLLAGGHEKNLGIGQSYEVETYDPLTHSFQGFACLNRKRALAQGVEIAGGQVVIAGNHQGHDAIEVFDGRAHFTHIKDMCIWRSSPYVLPTAPDDAIIFGSVWRNDRFEPCDTVESLRGEPFTVPLLREWMPMLYDQGNHAANSSIGDYSYLIAAYNADGEVAFIRITGRNFALLPTTCPIPTKTQWGAITFDRVAVVDREARRAYLVGNDTTDRAYVVSVEYDKTPAPLTLYYTDPLPDLGDTTPVLTPNGDLVIVGGITDSNFTPLSSVWKLHLGTSVVASSDTIGWWRWLLILVAFLAGVAFIFYRFLRRRRRQKPNESLTTDTLSESSESDDALMQRIRQLMEDEELYLNKDLKLSDIADRLNSNRSYISTCINTIEGCSFSGFVNRYRMIYAQQMLRRQPDKKISSVASESGFSSEQSFFRTFKSVTGMTPKEWVQEKVTK